MATWFKRPKFQSFVGAATAVNGMQLARLAVIGVVDARVRAAERTMAVLMANISSERKRPLHVPGTVCIQHIHQTYGTLNHSRARVLRLCATYFGALSAGASSRLLWDCPESPNMAGTISGVQVSHIITENFLCDIFDYLCCYRILTYDVLIGVLIFSLRAPLNREMPLLFFANMMLVFGSIVLRLLRNRYMDLNVV